MLIAQASKLIAFLLKSNYESCIMKKISGRAIKKGVPGDVIHLANIKN